MMKFFKLIRRTDFLGYNFSIRINSESGYKSLFGGILSILIVILSSIMIFYLGIEIFQKTEPMVLNSKIQNSGFGPYELSFKGQIQFFIGLEYANFTYYYDESIYTVTAEETTVEYIELNGTTVQNLRTREIQLRKCSEIYTNSDLEESNLNIPLDLFVCVDPSENAQIQGFWGSQVAKNLKVKLQKCQNRTESQVKCKSTTEIDNLIQNGVLSVYTSDYLINQKNLTSPTKKYFRDVYNYLSANDGLIYVIAYSDFLFKSDTGFLFPIYSNWNIPMISDIKNSYVFGEKQMFAFVNFQGFKLAESYQRSYSKIQDILTKVGGLIKALTLIGVAINYFFSKPFFIINNILDNHNFLKLKNERQFLNISKEQRDNNKNLIFISKPRQQVNPKINESIRNRSLGKFNFYNKINKMVTNGNNANAAIAMNTNLNKVEDIKVNKNNDIDKDSKEKYEFYKFYNNPNNNIVINGKNNSINPIKNLVNNVFNNSSRGNINYVNSQSNNSQTEIKANLDDKNVLTDENAKKILIGNKSDSKSKIKSKDKLKINKSEINIEKSFEKLNHINDENSNKYSNLQGKRSSNRFSFDSLTERRGKSFCNKLSLFKFYWCPKINPKLHNIFYFKERLIDKVLSLETLNKIYFDVELLKILNYNLKELRSMEAIHFNLFYDVEIYEKLRSYLYFNNNENSCSDLSILGLFNEEDNTFKKRLEYFIV